MDVPVEYRGREHTWLKHRVLGLYLDGWAHKLGSVARRRSVRLWYVDCFAGPWKARDDDLRDTSIVVGLDALEAARNTWLSRGYSIETHAVFVERDPRAYRALTKYLASRGGGTTTHPLNMEFGAAVPNMERLVGDDAAFVFVDPTGWKGAGMHFIAPLLRKPRRDVLVNVMFDHINRFKDDPRAFLRN
jgi:three-Cys-motif partner protein